MWIYLNPEFVLIIIFNTKFVCMYRPWNLLFFFEWQHFINKSLAVLKSQQEMPPPKKKANKNSKKREAGKQKVLLKKPEHPNKIHWIKNQCRKTKGFGKPVWCCRLRCGNPQLSWTLSSKFYFVCFHLGNTGLSGNMSHISLISCNLLVWLARNAYMIASCQFESHRLCHRIKLVKFILPWRRKGCLLH